MANCSEESTRKPIAPSLSEFLKEGGADKYIPRPEWLGHSACECCEYYRPIISHSRDSSYSMEKFDYLSMQTDSNNKCILEKELILDICDIAPNLPSTSSEKHFILDEDSHPICQRTEGCRMKDNEKVDSEDSKSEIIEQGHLFGSDKNCALIVAIKEKYSAAAIKLIEYGANPNHQNRHGVTPLILAAQKGLLGVVILLLEVGANPCQPSLTTTALIQASHFGHYNIVKDLIEKGALVNQTNQKGTTALMRACQEGHVNIARLLLYNHADVEHKNHDDMNALMLASQRGNLEIVETLLRHGSRVNEITLQHSTALMLACKRGHINVVQRLMSYGAELCMRDYRGQSAKSIAENNPHMTNFVPFMTLDTQMFLLRKNAHIQIKVELVKMWRLFNEDRASITSCTKSNGYIRTTKENIHDETVLSNYEPTKKLLLRTMALPLPLVGIIANYLQHPVVLEKQLEIVSRRRRIDPTSTIKCSLDLIDDILENVGFVDACDSSRLVAPTGFSSWVSYYSTIYFSRLPNLISV